MKELEYEISNFEKHSSTEICFRTDDLSLAIYVEAEGPGYYSYDQVEGRMTLDINEAKELRDKISLMIEELERRAV